MPDPSEIHFSAGRLYIAQNIAERYFPSINTVILLRQDRDLLVLPVWHAASGGYVLKIRNAAGDRVVNGADFFRDNGLPDDSQWHGQAAWCADKGGLRLYEIFLMQTSL